MILRLLATAFLSLFVYFSFAQNVPPVIWEKAFGGSYHDFCKHAEPTSDGGFIVIGTADSNDGDIAGSAGTGHTWVIKLNIAGTIQWKTRMDGDAATIKQTPDGGYIVAGTYINRLSLTMFNYNYWLSKLDAAGNVLWAKQYGGSSGDGATSVLQTPEGNYVLCGTTSSVDGDVHNSHDSLSHGTSSLSECWVIMVDASGEHNILKQRCLGGSQSDGGKEIISTADGGYLLIGATTSNDGDVSGYHTPSPPVYPAVPDGWVVKLDSSINIQWQVCVGGGRNEGINEARQTADGGFIIAGSKDNFEGEAQYHQYDAWVVKLDKTGGIAWQKYYGGSDADGYESVDLTPDGGYIFAGSTSSVDGDVTGTHTTPNVYGISDYWVVKTDSTGTLQWQKTLGGTDNDIASNISTLPDGGYIVAGTTFSNDGDVTGYHLNALGSTSHFADYWVLLLDSNSNVLPVHFLSFTGSEKGSYNELRWMVDNSFGTKAFSIERSIDGRVFAVIGSLPVSYAKPQTNFSFTDDNAMVSCYYRIKQTGNDGSVVYSPVISLSRRVSSLQVAIYPNPAKDVVSVRIATPENLSGKLIITDVKGTVLSARSVSITEGQTTIPLTVSQLPGGSYYITLTGETGNAKFTGKFLKE